MLSTNPLVATMLLSLIVPGMAVGAIAFLERRKRVPAEVVPKKVAVAPPVFMMIERKRQ